MEVFYETAAHKQLQELPRAIQDRIGHLIVRLQNWPDVSGVKSLRGNLAGHFRLRTGNYRLQFRVAGNQVIIERVGHRDGFYGD